MEDLELWKILLAEGGTSALTIAISVWLVRTHVASLRDQIEYLRKELDEAQNRDGNS